MSSGAHEVEGGKAWRKCNGVVSSSYDRHLMRLWEFYQYLGIEIKSMSNRPMIPGYGRAIQRVLGKAPASLIPEAYEEAYNSLFSVFL